MRRFLIITALIVAALFIIANLAACGGGGTSLKQDTGTGQVATPVASEEYYTADTLAEAVRTSLVTVNEENGYGATIDEIFCVNKAPQSWQCLADLYFDGELYRKSYDIVTSPDGTFVTTNQ